MRKVLKVAQREYNAAIRTKAFFIMLVLAPVMMSGGLIAIKVMERHGDTTDKTIAVVDHTGAIGPAVVEAARTRNNSQTHDLKTGRKFAPAYTIEVVEPNAADPDGQRLALSRRVRTHELHAFVEIGRDVLQPGDGATDTGIAYHAENAALDDARKWIVQPINERIRKVRAAEVGLPEAAAERVFRWMPVEPLGLFNVNAATGALQQAQRSDAGQAIGVPLAMLMLMFMMIMVGATPLLNAVLEEKLQRISEVLLGSIRPFELMLGKLIGTLGLSFTVIAIYLGGGFIVAQRMGLTGYIPVQLVPWFLVYMVAAIVLFGSLLIALGAACNDVKEAQSLMLPVWLLVMIPMFVWLPIVKEPLSRFATCMSLIPPFTPILMLLRQATPLGIPAWQPWVGLVGVLLFTTVCVWGAGRVFRVGLLMQGKTPRLSDLVRWAVRG